MKKTFTLLLALLVLSSALALPAVAAETPTFTPEPHTPASILTLIALAALGITLITVPVILLVKGWGKRGK